MAEVSQGGGGGHKKGGKVRAKKTVDENGYDSNGRPGFFVAHFLPPDHHVQ